MICVGESTVNEATAVPKRTEVTPVKLAPVMTTGLPPPREPVIVPRAVIEGDSTNE